MTMQPPEIWYKVSGSPSAPENACSTRPKQNRAFCTRDARTLAGREKSSWRLGCNWKGTPPPDYRWALNVDLFFEDRKRVEEKFQSILATKHSRMSPPTVSVSNPIESVFFRIEKVSKNFASQRFRLRIKPKLVIPPGLENQIPEGTGELNELYSRPIDSRSKPPSRSRSSSPRPRKRARTGGSAHMSDALDEIRAHGAKLDQYQQTLKSMLSVLHQCVTRLGAVDEVTEANQIMIRHNQELADKKNEAFGLRSGAAGAATFPVTEVPAPPKVQRQRSFTKLCLNLDDADSGKPTVPVYIPDDAPKVNIPPVVRQFRGVADTPPLVCVCAAEARPSQRQVCAGHARVPDDYRAHQAAAAQAAEGSDQQ